MSEVGTPPQAAGEMERRLATILCADVAGYSRMMGEDEERTVRVFRGHRAIFESLVAEHRGRIFNTAGDALLAEFSSAVEAVRCATDIQAALRTRNEHLAPAERMQFRIGINLGDVIVQGEDLLGDGVNVAARIQQSTEPGGICISGSVHEQIQNKLSLEFKLLGELPYKNIAKPVRTYTIAEGAAVTRPARGASARMAAIAALALALLGAGGYWAYSQLEAQRIERARIEAQLAAQTQAAEQARRAAEDAKREAEVSVQKESAEAALRRAEEERDRAAQERKLLEAERRAAEAGRKPAAAAAQPAASDGMYSGQLCNHLKEREVCWPVALTVSGGIAQASWLSRTRKTASARGTVADGQVRLTLSAWTPKGIPTEAILVGQLADGAISASGAWNDGIMITGEWHRGTFTATGSSTATVQGAARFDGAYEGRLCNQFRDKAPNCWAVPLVARSGRVEGHWLSPTRKPSKASGSIAADGTVEMRLEGWSRKGDPIEASLAGRAASGMLDVSGEWRGGQVKISGNWTRKP